MQSKLIKAKSIPLNYRKSNQEIESLLVICFVKRGSDRNGATQAKRRLGKRERKQRAECVLLDCGFACLYTLPHRRLTFFFFFWETRVLFFKNWNPNRPVRLEFIVPVPMPVQKQGSFVPENIPAYQVVSAVPETYIGFRPINSYRTGKRKVFLSHSHLPPATISTFSTSIRDRGLILAAATSSSSSSSSPLSLALSLSLSV